MADSIIETMERVFFAMQQQVKVATKMIRERNMPMFGRSAGESDDDDDGNIFGMDAG